MAIYRAGSKGKLYKGAAKVKKVYMGDVKVYSSGNICTYHVDTGTTYREEVDEGASCLSPKSFTPAKAGWTFVGWRQDTVANSTVLSSKIMGDEPVGLYAVFRQAVTLSYMANGGTGTVTAQTEYRYYNNGNVLNPNFTVKANGFSKSGYTFRHWTLGSTSGSIVQPGTALTLATSNTLYAYWLANTLVVFNGGVIVQGYVSFGGSWGSNGHLGAYANGNSKYDKKTGSLSLLSLGSYKKAIIKMSVTSTNSYGDERYATGSISGLLGNKHFDTSRNPTDTISGTYTISSTGTVQGTVDARTDYNGGNHTWCGGTIILESITLSL